MLYAVVDIETTGGTPSGSRITEICVVVTDGREVLQEYETLLNPGCPIPRGITNLTGITDEMVASAPVFADIAQELYHLLHDKVFVAHNVNFDYSFIHREFERLGLPFFLPKICSAKSARKAFPGRRSYSLGSICASLGIEIENRHRAGGDARATTKLLHLIGETIGADQLEEMAGRSMKNFVLPPGVESADIERLPSSPGVYYFLNTSGKPLYIGKAINIKTRVLQHFDRKRGKTALQLERIASIDFEETGSELMALLVEAEAISRHWPEWNKAGKTPASRYSIVHYPTVNGELRLQTIRRARNNHGGIGFTRLSDARNSLAAMISENGICSSLAHSSKTCYDETCYCKEDAQTRLKIHNSRVEQALEAYGNESEELLILCRGRDENETGVVYMSNGSVLGWGFAGDIPENPEPDMLVKRVKDLTETRAIAGSFLRRISSGTIQGYRLVQISSTLVKPAKSKSAKTQTSSVPDDAIINNREVMAEENQKSKTPKKDKNPISKN